MKIILYRGIVSNRGKILLLDFFLENGIQNNCCGFIKKVGRLGSLI